MIEDEIRDILAALLAETGATAAAIVADDGPSGVPLRRRPLGADRSLQLELATRTPKPQPNDPEPRSGDSGLSADAQLEIAVRQLRAVARRWNVAQLPLMRVPPAAASSDRVISRVEAFLHALANSAHGHNAMVMRRGLLLASAHPVDEVWASRLTFIARRSLATHAPHSSHGEIIDPDAYAMTFYYGAVLVVAVDAPYAVDFLRHRCRLVARELSLLLPMLEPDPETPAMLRPT